MQGNPLATQAPRKEKQEQMNTQGDNCVYLGRAVKFWNTRALYFINKSYINPFFSSSPNLIEWCER